MVEGKLTERISRAPSGPMSASKKIEAWFAECPGALVAFSGGVDSSLVAFLASEHLGQERSIAVISASPSLKLSELDDAKGFAATHGIRLEIVVTREMENPNYLNNPSNRCYFCKHTLYDELSKLKEQYPNWWILNGTNTDDFGDYRPGLQAANEFEVRAPLAECGLDKEAVRALAAEYSLACWDKPASPCLSSRVPYGQEITVKKLRQIEVGEATLVEFGFPVSRVRHYGDMARLEVPSDAVGRLLELRESLAAAFLEIGFQTIELDEEGFVSGKLNRVLKA